TGFIEAGQQRPPVIRPPGLVHGELVGLLPVGRLENYREGTIECQQFLAASRKVGPGMVHPQLESELAHESLVYGPAKLVPRRRGQPEVFCRDLAIRRKTAREVNSEPATKRIRGPKVHAAGAPTK